MTLKQALLEELQKLRLNRERKPEIKQAKTKKPTSKNTLLEEAKKLLENLED